MVPVRVNLMVPVVVIWYQELLYGTSKGYMVPVRVNLMVPVVVIWYQ